MTAPTVWFDVEDLYHHFDSGATRMSGIQRLAFEIYVAAQASAGESGAVRFVRHCAGPPWFEVVDWSETAALFHEEAEAVAAAPESVTAEREAPAAVMGQGGAARRAMRNLADRLPGEVRRPLVLASVLQLQVIAALGRVGVNLVVAPTMAAVARSRRAASALTRRKPKKLVMPSFAALARPGDTLLVLGSPWFRADYSWLARWLRDERRMRFGVLVHDLVPIRCPEWCHTGVIRAFKDWYADVLPFCDVVLSNSRHTARDVEAYARESGIALPGPVRPVPVGSGFGLPDVAAEGVRPPGFPAPGSYVLFVSTIEARKNHALAVRVWRGLLADVQAGRRAAETVPDLVFAGRVGWLVADLMQQLENTEWLGGRVRLVENPSDAALRALYEGCLFTLFPSLHEGWGLPVTESLALGKPCLSSDAAALPEAGGALCRYFDPEDAGAAQRAVEAVLDDRPGLAAWEAQVRREFRRVPWTATAQTVLDVVAGLGG